MGNCFHELLENEATMTAYLTTADLASLLGVTPQTVRNLLSTQPDSFPCAYRFGNMRRVLFRPEEVSQFLRARAEARKEAASSKHLRSKE